MEYLQSKHEDERFWACFISCVDALQEQPEQSVLSAEWWNWPLLRRGEELLKRIRSISPARVDIKVIEGVTLGGLVLCEQAPVNYRSVLQERVRALRALVDRKGRDYNAGDVSILEYWLLGNASIIHEIHKRTLRLVSIGRSGQRPEFESLPEIGLDIAAYALFLIAYIKSGVSNTIQN